MRLVSINPQLSDYLHRSPEETERDYRVALAGQTEQVRAVIDQTLDLIERVPRPRPFGGYLAVDSASGQVVGTCAFKGPPGPDGAIEIAYHTFQPYEGRGHATDMARALIALATSWPGVTRVIAHTLPAQSASTTVLTKAGMRMVGEVDDPEDGRVWRWQHQG